MLLKIWHKYNVFKSAVTVIITFNVNSRVGFHVNGGWMSLEKHAEFGVFTDSWKRKTKVPDAGL